MKTIRRLTLTITLLAVAACSASPTAPIAPESSPAQAPNFNNGGFIGGG